MRYWRILEPNALGSQLLRDGRQNPSEHLEPAIASAPLAPPSGFNAKALALATQGEYAAILVHPHGSLGGR